MSKRARTLLLVLLAIALLLVGLMAAGWAWFDWNNHKKPTLIDTAVSPDGQYTLRLEQIGNPTFFGPATARITLWEEGGRRPMDTLEASVYNDGAGLHPESWAVVWQSDRVTVTMKGCEQTDKVYTLVYQ